MCAAFHSVLFHDSFETSLVVLVMICRCACYLDIILRFSSFTFCHFLSLLPQVEFSRFTGVIATKVKR